MEALDIFLGIGFILIALIVFRLLWEDYRRVKREELAQREVRRLHDQCLADARERARGGEDEKASREEPNH
jgi:hypothetical protein